MPSPAAAPERRFLAHSRWPVRRDRAAQNEWFWRWLSCSVVYIGAHACSWHGCSGPGHRAWFHTRALTPFAIYCLAVGAPSIIRFL